MSLPILARHHSVGAALWLWEYLRDNTKVIDAAWMPVADGIEITDVQLGYRIDVSEGTARRWRMRLEKLGFLYSERTRARYRRLWISNQNAPRWEQSLLQAPATGFVN